MIVFSEKFVPIKYPGYFWNLDERWLYSIKSGTLQPLKYNKPFTQWQKRKIGWHFKISVKGKQKLVSRLSHADVNIVKDIIKPVITYDEIFPQREMDI